MVRLFKVIHRDYLLLAGLVAVIVVCFSVTTFAARAYHRKQEQFGAAWYERGEQALRQSRPADAVDDFRNALAYSPDNNRYRLRLAQALMADHRPQEARAHLLSLWEEEPGDGVLNLELARLAAMWGDTSQAVRYYHAAIYGVWPDDPFTHRLAIRFELSEYLLTRSTPQDVKSAQAELVALAGVLPPQDADAQVRLGTLFLQTGLYPRALTAFQAALADKPNLIPALKAASEAAFQLGEYETAQHYLLPVVAQDPKDESSLEKLNLCELVFKLDPSRHGLSSRERARRALYDLQLALARAQKCASSAGPAPDKSLATLVQQAKSMGTNEKLLARDPDAIDKTTDMAFKLAQVAAQCGTPGLEDKALALLAQQEASR